MAPTLNKSGEIGGSVARRCGKGTTEGAFKEGYRMANADPMAITIEGCRGCKWWASDDWCRIAGWTYARCYNDESRHSELLVCEGCDKYTLHFGVTVLRTRDDP